MAVVPDLYFNRFVRLSGMCRLRSRALRMLTRAVRDSRDEDGIVLARSLSRAWATWDTCPICGDASHGIADCPSLS